MRYPKRYSVPFASMIVFRLYRHALECAKRGYHSETCAVMYGGNDCNCLANLFVGNAYFDTDDVQTYTHCMYQNRLNPYEAFGKFAVKKGRTMRNDGMMAEDYEQPPTFVIDGMRPNTNKAYQEMSLIELRAANHNRQREVFKQCLVWTNGDIACEVAGELGELLNFVKKDFRGDIVDRKDIAYELADVIICLDRLAERFGIGLDMAIGTVYLSFFRENTNAAREGMALKTNGDLGARALVHLGRLFSAIELYSVTVIRDSIYDFMVVLDALAARYGISLSDAVREKFNVVSKKRGSRFFL